MKNLSNIITDYLANRTDYAVQIVGPFGHGKTYHYKKVLERVISGTSIAGNELKKYKPIYISLFGLKSTEELAAKIVLSFYQSALFKGYFKGFSRWKRLKFTGSILKIGLRGFLNFKRLGSIDDYVADIKAAARNVLDSRELLVCFDDLERRDESLSIHDFAGYINSLTDEGVKVLIIANDDLLLKKEKEYSDLKEKIIGITVEFVPDVAETISNIIEERYKGSPVYHKYLLEHLPLILSFSGSVQHNFRHVGYALDRFHVCYATIRAGIIDHGHEISEKLQEKLTDIMQLILALAAEYKASQLKHTDQDQYEHRANLAFKVLQTTRADTGSREKSRLESFLEKYGISSQNYFLYKRVLDLVLPVA
jgi:Cdc6-like AAA superfamily ATPase